MKQSSSSSGTSASASATTPSPRDAAAAFLKRNRLFGGGNQGRPDQHHNPPSANTAKDNPPSYCFVLIGQKQTAKGLKPIVWVFNQLMGISADDKERSKSTKRAKGKANNNHLSPLKAEETCSSEQSQLQPQEPKLDPSGPIKSIVGAHYDPVTHRYSFRLESNIQMNIQFPAKLLKLLPTSHKKAEAQGSAAICKTISKASQLGVQAAHAIFVRDYHASSSSSQ